jgi:PTH1 family peptidyl-tRNA hydrolase
MNPSNPGKLALIVGLGNPGSEYAATRHNVGWLALDEVNRLAGQPTGFKKKFHGEFSKAALSGRECVFLRPETFMNESGRSVQQAVLFFHVAPSDLIVLHDELDLPFGDVRVKLGGGHAGHNGLRSLVQHLGTPDFVRVRMGIGRPPPGFKGDVADYVLSGFSAIERPDVPRMIDQAAKAVVGILTEGIDRAMNEANTRRKREGGDGGAGTSGARGTQVGENEARSNGGQAPDPKRGDEPAYW